MLWGAVHLFSCDVLLQFVDGGRESVTPSKRPDTGARPSLTFRQTQALQLAKKYCQDVTMKAVSLCFVHMLRNGSVNFGGRESRIN